MVVYFLLCLLCKHSKLICGKCLFADVFYVSCKLSVIHYAIGPRDIVPLVAAPAPRILMPLVLTSIGWLQHSDL